MPTAKCGFFDPPGGPPASQLLVAYGPTLWVDVGFDPNYEPSKPNKLPVPGVRQINALVDTGASASCIDNSLATQLNLPIADRQKMSGISGSIEVNMYLAQIHVPTLNHTIYGLFAGVDLVVGGQSHQVLIGRTFLTSFKMTYNGKTGDVAIESA